jgi:hypothetical protein
MSTTTTSSRTSRVQWLIKSRPPSLTWSLPAPLPPNQPPLDLNDHESDVAEAAGPDHRGVRVSMVKARWAAKPRTGLPDAREWSTTLALALTRSLLGQRPVAHPNRSKCALAGTGRRGRAQQDHLRRHAGTNGRRHPGVHLRSRCDPVRYAVLVATSCVLAGSAGPPDHHDRRSGFRCGHVLPRTRGAVAAGGGAAKPVGLHPGAR